jgi:hypothetical protein
MNKPFWGMVVGITAPAGMLVLLLLMFAYPQWFPGILYPVKDFDLELLNPVDELDLRGREPGKAYPEGFVVWFRHSSAASQFTFQAYESYIGTRPRKKLYIKEIAWEWEGASGFFVRDFLHEFSEGAWSHPENGWHCISWVVGIIPDPIPFIRMFQKKKIGEVFPFRLTIRYRLDDEPEIVQVLEYRVTARKGRYEPTYTFLF